MSLLIKVRPLDPRITLAEQTDMALNKIMVGQGASSSPIEEDKPSAAGGLAIFGDGSDGDISSSSNITLTRDMYYNDLTINSGHTLYSSLYRIFVKGTLINEGTISCVGANGSTDYMPEKTLGGGKGGGADGADGQDADDSLGGSGGLDGEGNTGGVAAAAKSGAGSVFGILCFTTDGTPARMQGGGGGAGGNGATVKGGQGGGIVAIAAKTIVNTSGTISANGGNGVVGNAGGGGGGAIILLYNSFASGTETVTGGALIGTGAVGAVGRIIEIQN